MPYELRDLGLLKLFFADVLGPAQARELLEALRRRSEDRIAALTAIEPVAHAVGQEGNLYPLLTLRLGLGHHQAMIDICRDFEFPASSQRLSDGLGGA
jgi:Virulence activator alpha C-term